MGEITRELARFAIETDWEDLPASIVQETKLILMEHLGVALAALSTDKGKMMAALGKRYGGPPESSIIGLGDKVSCSNAVLVNGELMITLDYHDIIAGGHDGTYVIPTVLSIAERCGASGKDVILATSVGLEISARLARAVGRHNITPDDVRRQRSGRPGLTGNAYSNLGAAAAAGRLMGLGEDRTLHAIGIASHLCMVLSYGRWGAGGHRYMAKYGVPGWQSTGAVTAVLLAEMGYTGDTTVLDDPERGFTFYVGYPNWYPQEIMSDLAKAWCFDYRLHYKPYPCCAVFHSALDCFCDIIEEKGLAPVDIETVRVFGRAGAMGPPRGGEVPATGNEINGIAGAQFSVPYNIAVAAHRVTRGVEWVDPDTMNNREILAFMDRVVSQPDSDFMRKYAEAMEKDPLSALARVEVAARGQTFTVERQHRIGTAGTEASWTEREIVEKFRHNTERILTKDKTEKAVEALLGLEKLDNVRQLMHHITL